MEGMMLGGWNSDGRAAELCETEEFVNKLAEMLKDRNVELSEIFEYLAQRNPQFTAKDIEYQQREHFAEVITHTFYVLKETTQWKPPTI